MRVEPYRAHHLHLLIAQGVQSAQIREISHVPANYANVPPGLSMTALEGDHVVLCGGIIPLGPGMGMLWAALSADAGNHMLWLHRATRRFLDIEPRRRIEATVEEGFPAGCRWLELLGFRWEGPMPGYGLKGETHIRYGRVREDLY